MTISLCVSARQHREDRRTLALFVTEVCTGTLENFTASISTAEILHLRYDGRPAQFCQSVQRSPRRPAQVEEKQDELGNHGEAENSLVPQERVGCG